MTFFCSSLFSCQNCKEFVAAEILPSSCSPYSKALFPEQETSEILGSHSGVAENSIFLGCDAVSIGKPLQTFRWVIVSIKQSVTERHNATSHVTWVFSKKPCVQVRYVPFVFQGPKSEPHTGGYIVFNCMCKIFSVQCTLG